MPDWYYIIGGLGGTLAILFFIIYFVKKTVSKLGTTSKEVEDTKPKL